MINKDLLTSVIEEARSGDTNLKNIAFCSPGGIRILKYLYKTKWPDFSMAGAARQILEPAIMNSIDQQVWSIIKKEIPDNRRKHKNYWDNVSITNINEDIVKEIINETSTYPACIVQIYSPRLAVYFRYLKMINAKYSVSKGAALVFEYEMSRRYPAFWKRIINMP